MDWGRQYCGGGNLATHVFISSSQPSASRLRTCCDQRDHWLEPDRGGSGVPWGESRARRPTQRNALHFQEIADCDLEQEGHHMTILCVRVNVFRDAESGY